MGGRWVYTVSNRGFSRESHVDVHALFYMCINQLEVKWREGFY